VRLALIVLTTIAIGSALIPMIAAYRVGPDRTGLCIAARDAWHTSSACSVGARTRLFLTATGLGAIGLVGFTTFVVGATRRRKRELAAAF
jgi:hypothetical protein